MRTGLITADEANTLGERASLNPVFLPGFSTNTGISPVSGRGVGMDVARTNILRLKGRIELGSTLGAGSRLTIIGGRRPRGRQRIGYARREPRVRRPGRCAINDSRSSSLAS